MITGIRKVVLTVGDQERARDFWVNRVGFTVAEDAQYPDGRWLEVAPPDRAVLLILDPRKEGETRRAMPDELPHSDVFFSCDDIRKTFEELQARGVHFHTPPKKLPFGWWAMFEDFEGTRYALQQG